MGMIAKRTEDGIAQLVKSTADASWTLEQGQGGGEHGIGSAGQYLAATPESNGVVVAPNAADVAVSSGVPARLFGIAGANGVANGSVVVIKDGAITVETFPALSIPVAGLDFRGMKFNTSLVVNITVAAGTSLKVFWGPLLT